MPGSEAPSLVASLARLQSSAGVIFRGLENRAELAVLELGEARDHVAFSAILFAATAVGVFLAGMALTLLIAAIFWDTPHRVTALGSLAGVEVVACASCALWLRARWRQWSAFSATLEQLEKDHLCLRKLLTCRDR